MQTQLTTPHQHHWELLETYRKESQLLEMDKRKKDEREKLFFAIPPRYQGKNFNDFTANSDAQIQVKNIVHQYAETFGKRSKQGNSIIFMGKIGTGKTLLARILQQCLINHDLSVEYHTSLSFLKSLHDKQFSSYEAFDLALKTYRHLPFLIIDEVTEGCGKGAYPADWERNLLRMIIDVRYQYCKCTLIITNRNQQELIERLGEPTIDRLSEKGIRLAFNWESFRKK